MTTVNDESRNGVSDDSQIVPGISIANLLQQRDAVMERLEQAIGLLIEAEQIASSAHIGFPKIAILNPGDWYRNAVPITGDNSNGNAALNRSIQDIDTAGWRYLLNESGLRSLMSAARRDQFDSQLREGDIPPMTADTVRETFSAMHEGRVAMMAEGVVDCFQKLSWDYKTNNPVCFGKRIIMRRITDACTISNSVNLSEASTLDDLIRVFYLTDSKPEPDHRQGCYHWLTEALNKGGDDYPKIAENDYLSIKLFKNGNGHILFKRPDLVKVLNETIARVHPGALPAAR